ncbi:MAG: hypothetical protein H6550_16255 [Chitinophagales bacterium]|nr:hypothetical protein [Chitinophagales bacterium]
MRKGVEGTNKIWRVIHADANETVISEKVFYQYDKMKIQAYINHFSHATKSGDTVTYGAECDRLAFYTLFEVENFAGKLKRLLINSTANIGRAVYKSFHMFDMPDYLKLIELTDL